MELGRGMRAWPSRHREGRGQLSFSPWLSFWGMEKSLVPSASLSTVTTRGKDGVAYCVACSISLSQQLWEGQRELRDMLKVRQPNGGRGKKRACSLSGELWTN